MKIYLETGEVLEAENKYLDFSQKLILFYIKTKEGKRKKVFINPEIITYIDFEDIEPEENINNEK